MGRFLPGLFSVHHLSGALGSSLFVFVVVFMLLVFFLKS